MKRTSWDIIESLLSLKINGRHVLEKVHFVVAPDANKTQIKRAVEEVFGVKVASVMTQNRLGKEKRVGVHVGKRPDTKKAVVTLTEDSKTIEFFENIN